MAELTTATPYISTVTHNHTVVLPEHFPVGVKVAVSILPSEAVAAEEARRERFERVMAAIRAAITEGYTGSNISDEDLDALIERARHAGRTS